MTGQSVRDRIEEPVLAMRNIQGLAVPGFFKPHQALIYVRHGDAPEIVAQVKAFLRQIAPHIASGRHALSDRRTYRHVRGRLRRPVVRGVPAPKLKARSPLLAVGFTHTGLRKLIGDDEVDAMHSLAFKTGLAKRAPLLGDPAHADVPGHPDNWLVGKTAEPLDFMLVVAGDDERAVAATAAFWQEQLMPFVLSARIERGDRITVPGFRGASAKGREHFGFVDGISQPGIRGRSTRKKGNYLTESHASFGNCPLRSLQGLPGQSLVWPGEFVLGYPKSGPDPLLPGPIAQAERPWMKHGSFLVYRRLRQDVGGFWRSMVAASHFLSALPGFSGLTPESLASQLVGRRPDGAPLSRLQGQAGVGPRLGSDPCANNDFLFDADTPPLPGDEAGRRFPTAQADPLGLACPLAAHIRKVNPRDAVSDVGGSSGVYSRRILRVGITYGRPYSEDTSAEDRGVLFMCIQASIEDQFEFLQTRWMNDDRLPRAPSGHDMIAGRNVADGGSGRRCTIFASGGQQGVVEIGRPAVTPTGGGYFFLPSLPALRKVLAK